MKKPIAAWREREREKPRQRYFMDEIRERERGNERGYLIAWDLR